MTYILLTFAPETSSLRNIPWPCTNTPLFLPLVPSGHYPWSPGNLGVSGSAHLMCSCLPKNTSPYVETLQVLRGKECSGVLSGLGRARLSSSRRLHSYSILHLSLASAPKVAGIMSPSENSFLSFYREPLLSAEFWLLAVGLGQAKSEAFHVLLICLCRFSWHVSQTTSSSSLGVPPRCSPHQFIKHTQEKLKPSLGSSWDPIKMINVFPVLLSLQNLFTYIISLNPWNNPLKLCCLYSYFMGIKVKFRQIRKYGYGYLFNKRQSGIHSSYANSWPPSVIGWQYTRLR